MHAPGANVPPSVYIIAGPNGVGKTTFATQFLPRYANCTNFINADLIARGLAPFSPEAAAFHSGRLVLEQADAFAAARETFGFETTLSGKAYLRRVMHLRESGYSVHIFFLWLPHVQLALSRIRRRVRAGGHNIPPRDARRRYGRSAANFLLHYRHLADEWMLFDNAGAEPIEVAQERAGRLTIMKPDAFRNFEVRYGRG